MLRGIRGETIEENTLQEAIDPPWLVVLWAEQNMMIVRLQQVVI